MTSSKTSSSGAFRRSTIFFGNKATATAFDLQKIKSTAVNMFIDEFSKNTSSDPTVGGRGVAMAVARNDDNCSKRGKGKNPWKKNSGGGKEQ